MPRVPTYEGPQIAQAQMPSGTLQVQPADVSAIGRGLSNLGQDVQQIYTAERNRAIEASLNQAFAAANTLETETLYGTDKGVGVMQMEGGDLMSKSSGIRQNYQRKLDDIESQLSTREAKDKFQRSKLGMLSSFDRSLQQRIGVQRDRTVELSFNQVNESAINRVTSALAVDPNNVVFTDQSHESGWNTAVIDDVMDQIAIAGRQRAFDPLTQVPDANRAEAAKRLTLENQGKALKQILPMLIETNPQAAKVIADRYADAIPDKARVFDHINKSVFSAQAKNNADIAISIAGSGDPILGQSFGTLAEQHQRALEVVRKNGLSTDQKTNDATENYINTIFNEKKTLQRQKDAELSEQIYSDMVAGKIQTQETLRADPRFPVLDGSTQMRLLNGFDKSEAERPQVIQRLNDWAFSSDPALVDAFKNADFNGEVVLVRKNLAGQIEETKVSLTQKEFQEAMRMQKSLRERGQTEQSRAASDNEKDANFFTKEFMASKALKEGRESVAYHRKLTEAFSAQQLTPEQKRHLADAFAAEFIQEGKWFGGKKPLREMTTADIVSTQGRIKYEDIPASERQKIEADLLRVTGKKPTSDEVGKAYLKRIQGILAVPLKK